MTNWYGPSFLHVWIFVIASPSFCHCRACTVEGNGHHTLRQLSRHLCIGYELLSAIFDRVAALAVTLLSFLSNVLFLLSIVGLALLGGIQAHCHRVGPTVYHSTYTVINCTSQHILCAVKSSCGWFPNHTCWTHYSVMPTSCPSVFLPFPCSVRACVRVCVCVCVCVCVLLSASSIPVAGHVILGGSLHLSRIPGGSISLVAGVRQPGCSGTPHCSQQVAGSDYAEGLCC